MGQQTHADPTLTNSKKYESFDVPSKERTAFIFSENDRVNEKLKQSPNRKVLETYLQTMNKPSKRTLARVEAGRIQRFDGGYSKPQELYLVTDTTQELLFSNFQFAKNNTLRISKARVNGQQTLMVVTMTVDGSSDDAAFVIVDLQTKKLLDTQPVRYHGKTPQVFWKSEKELLYKDMTDEGRDVIKSLTLTPEGRSTTVFLDNYKVLSADDETIIFFSMTDGEDSVVVGQFGAFKVKEDLSQYEYLGFLNGRYYFSTTQYSEEAKDSADLASFDPFAGLFKIEKSFPGVIHDFTLLEKKFAYIKQNGFKSTLKLYVPAIDQTTSLEIPDYAVVAISDSSETPGAYDLYFTSDLNDKEMKWDGQTNSVTFDEAFKAALLESPELSLDVSFRMVPSFDGTPVPIRVVSKKGVQLKNAPVLIESYGGFATTEYLSPSGASDMLNEFFKRGGVYVGTGLRGGNEFGEAWHLAAYKSNKYKTYEDLAAVAKSFIDSGESSKERIAITGESNGGLTVAATGLLYPQYFGLVIAGSGVLDLLGKETLDARFRGWRGEYGNANKPEEAAYLQRISPLEQISRAENGPKFLIMNGRSDTRVNPAHSIKFAKAAADLRQAGKPVQVDFISLNNSGHSFSSPDNDFIALRADLIKWTHIYDEFGITF